MVLHSFKPPQPAPEWRVGGRSGPAGPPAEPGCIRRTGTQVEDSGEAGVAARRGGPKGQATPTRQIDAAKANAVAPQARRPPGRCVAPALMRY